jgi:DNA-binding response OmpR family regulator
MNKVLIVEDDREIRALLAEHLRDNGYEVVELADGMHADKCIREDGIELVLLDLMLPFKSGDQVLRDIRKITNIPVIIISARETTQNKIDLLRLGADDYITKPFDLEEVLARMECALRRAGTPSDISEILESGNLVLDLSRNVAYLKDDEQEITLTAKEFAIMELLMRYPKKIFSKSNLFVSVWGEEYFNEDNTLTVHISNLRNKLKKYDADHEYIDTVWGIGYRLHKDGE